MPTSELTQPANLTNLLVHLSLESAGKIARQYGTPCYAYSESVLVNQAKQALAFPAPFGLTVRYAMKANPLAAILQTFHSLGVHIDASSGAEVERACKAGIPASHIMLTSQEIPANIGDLVADGVIYNACSLHQLREFGRQFPGHSVSIRFNPGAGSGHRRSVAVGGPTSSFGVWHEDAPRAVEVARQYNLRVTGIHSHIGCGADPDVWQSTAQTTLSLLELFPEATTLNLGGGFKVARYPGEQATDLQALGAGISRMLTEFAQRTQRHIKLEIEPGTFLVANAGTLLAQVIDLTSTGASGYHFAKLNTGMNDFMRPALHGSQHPIIPLGPARPSSHSYVVVGHNCESTDLLTPDPDDPEVPLPRLLPELHIGDLIAIEGAGAYSSAMRLLGYNSFATPNEVLVTENGGIKLINRRISIAEFTASEVY